MTSIAGLNLTSNLSYFAVPTAFVLALIPHVYAGISAREVYDHEKPREFTDRLVNSTSLTTEKRNLLLRAQAASDNGFETLGFFGAAVVAANQVGLPAGTLNALAWGYVASRVAYNIAWVIMERSGARSLFWHVGNVMTFSLLIKAGIVASSS